MRTVRESGQEWTRLFQSTFPFPDGCGLTKTEGRLLVPPFLIKTKLLTANIQEVFPWFSKYHNAPKTNYHNEYAYINTTKLVWCELLVTKVISICIPVVESNPKYVENRPEYSKNV